MRKKSFAKKYATSLLDIALEEKRQREIRGELDTISSLIVDSPELSTALLHPMYDLDDRRRLAESVCERAGLSRTIQRFLAILVETRDVRLLPEISNSYSMMEDELEGRLHVVIEAPWEPDSETETRIREKLHSLTGREIILVNKVD
ncbi:MAG: ATP synthase F1 subunit delta, partial [Thermodesulfobacteriota bacterium]